MPLTQSFDERTLSDDVVIKVEHVSKKFSRSLKRSMTYGMKDIARNIFGMASNSDHLRKGEFWAVKDVSFELRRGECLGVIGLNGAGKTTLLSMLNGIYMPDKGKITIKGKTGALISVGAGFHPMLTGRENIYVNGAVLGMSKAELDENFDAIVEFADIGDFLDMPVKNYSSGMFVRLGFSIAVHCQPEILLIDEILSVGDLSFQNKCLRRLNQILEKMHAVVFVSHKLEQVRNLCNRVLILDNGMKVFYGDPHEALAKYHHMVHEKSLIATKSKKAFHSTLHKSSGDIIFGESGILDESGIKTEKIGIGEPLTTFFEFETTKNIEELYFTAGIRDDRNYNCIVHISNYNDRIKFRNISKGKHKLIVKFLTPNLVPGVYFPIISIRNGITNETYERVFNLKPFIIEGEYNQSLRPRGMILTESQWQMDSISSEAVENDNIKLKKDENEI